VRSGGGILGSRARRGRALAARAPDPRRAAALRCGRDRLRAGLGRRRPTHPRWPHELAAEAL